MFTGTSQVPRPWITFMTCWWRTSTYRLSATAY